MELMERSLEQIFAQLETLSKGGGSGLDQEKKPAAGSEAAGSSANDSRLIASVYEWCLFAREVAGTCSVA